MTPQRWQQVKELFNSALERDAAERSSFLDRACGGDDALRKEVDVLLSSDERTRVLIDQPVLGLAAELLADPQSSVLGRTIGAYEIEKEVGRGGMGEVYLARDTRLNRAVAVKLLPDFFVHDRDRVRRFQQEARAASSLNHPNIVTIHEVAESDGLRFIVSEFVEGTTLREAINAGGMKLEQALDISIQTASALAAAHKAGIVHRDIKPENIMVRPDGYVKVLDFGLAKLTERGQDGRQDGALANLSEFTTLPGMIMGTARYMSPEQARGQKVDQRTDIFSLGVVFYEMIAGRAPFDGETASDAIASILMVEPVPVSQCARGLPGDVDGIVTRALVKDRDERYQTAKDLLSDLTRLRQRLEFEAELERSTQRPPGISGGDRSGKQQSRAQSQPLGSASSPASVKSTLHPRIISSAGEITRHTVGRDQQGFISATARVLSPLVSVRSALILLMAIVAIGAVWWFLIRTRPEPQTGLLSSLRFVQLANWKNEAGEGVRSILSPDGKLIAFSSLGGGVLNLWIKQTISGDPDPIQITRGEWNNWNPIFSPDGNQIAFQSNRGRQFGIWRMPTFGGTPTLLRQIDTTEFRLKHWSRDNRTIYYLYDNKTSETDLFALDMVSGETILVTRFNQHVTDLSLSPTEDRIAYVARQNSQSDIWMMPVAGGTPVQVTADSMEDENPAWLPDGKRIIYNSDRDGTQQICVVYVDEHKPLQITFGDTNVFVEDVSSDGTKVLYQTLKEESDVWGVKLASANELELASDVNVKFWPNVSPDGKAIAFQSIREVGKDANLRKSVILMRPTEGEGRQIQLAADGIQPQWSPDGERVAFLRWSENRWSIWTVRASGGDEKQLTTDRVGFRGYATGPYNRILTKDYCWSPDSKKIGYCTASQASRVCVMPAHGSGEIQTLVATDPDLIVCGPLFSPDARLIAYLSRTRVAPADGKHIWSICVVDAGTGKSAIIFQKNSFLRPIGWSGNNIVAGMPDIDLQPEPRAITLFQVPAEGGGAREITRIKSAYLYNSFLSPDGRFIAVPLRQDGKDNIWLIPVTGGQARRLTSNNDPKLYFSSMAWSPDGKAIYYGKQSTKTLISMIDNFR